MVVRRPKELPMSGHPGASGSSTLAAASNASILPRLLPIITANANRVKRKCLTRRINRRRRQLEYQLVDGRAEPPMPSCGWYE